MSHNMFKTIVFIFMALIAYNLFRGLYFLVTGKDGGRQTARALSWRIGISFALFLLLMALKLSGMVEPHALNERPANPQSPSPDEDKKDEGKTLEEIQQQQNDGRVRLKQ